MSDHIASLEAAASVLNGLQYDPNAQVCFDLFAGGVSWSDEAPPFSIENVGKSFRVLRPLIRFRSSLIEGNPDERFRLIWEESLSIMPQWPGFLPARRDKKLSPLLSELQAKAQLEIDKLEACLAATLGPLEVKPATQSNVAPHQVG